MNEEIVPSESSLEVLSIQEHQELQSLEEIIRPGLLTFVEVGDALEQVRSKRLYRQDFKTFQEYCVQKLGITRRRADQLIGSSEVAQNLRTTVLISSERQARPLVGLPKQKQIQVVKKIIRSGQPITARTVSAALAPLIAGKPDLTSHDPDQTFTLHDIDTWWATFKDRLAYGTPSIPFVIGELKTHLASL